MRSSHFEILEPPRAGWLVIIERYNAILDQSERISIITRAIKLITHNTFRNAHRKQNKTKQNKNENKKKMKIKQKRKGKEKAAIGFKKVLE